ncbi:DUF6676 family protein [Tomitella fengzijianii]|uniref:Rv1476 family membrane protein n=1 Tax=Tomitella fengzijianii TaxID=2597660 RepID=UPI00131D0A7D|nr:DUF6676 family protein [Tomitella fengzijianii]
MSSAAYASETLAGMNVQQVIQDVAEGGVSVPPEYADAAPGLRDVVSDAQHEGLELSVVVVPHDQWGMKLGSPIAYPERLRDLSTAVGESEGGTVLTLGPAQIGTYSDTLSRFTLESAENVVQHPRSPELTVAAQQFLDDVEQDQFPWTAVSAVLLVLVVLVVAAGTVLNVRRARA